MKSFLSEIRIAIVATILFAVVCSGIYPVVIWGVSQLLFPHQANGSLVTSPDNKTRIGSSLLAQGFSGAKYFHPRPSNAGFSSSDTTPAQEPDSASARCRYGRCFTTRRSWRPAHRSGISGRSLARPTCWSAIPRAANRWRKCSATDRWS